MAIYQRQPERYGQIEVKQKYFLPIYNITLADPGGGGRTRRAPPPNGRGPMILYAQNAKISQFFLRSLRSRFILDLILLEIWQKTR